MAFTESMVDPQISQSKMKSLRNTIRGFLDRKVFEQRPAVYKTLLKKIYDDKDIQAVRWAENEIRTNPIYRHVPVPSDFALKDDPFETPLLISMRSPAARMYTVIDRLNQNQQRLGDCLASLRVINEHLHGGRTGEAVEAADIHINEFGQSHAILRKIAFIRSFEHSITDESLDALTDKVSFFKRDVIRPSLADAYSGRRQYINVVKNISRISANTNRGRYRKAISNFVVQPIAYTRATFEAGIEAFAQTCLLDSLIYLNLNLSNENPPDFLSDYLPFWDSIAEPLKAAMADFHYSPNDLLANSADLDDPLEVDDYQVYRHMTAFAECRNIRDFRAVADFYLTIPPESQDELEFVANSRRRIFGDSIVIEDLARKAVHPIIDFDRFDPLRAGILQKSVAMAIYFRNRQNFDDVDSDTFLSLMNCTAAANELLSRRVLVELRRKSSERGDLLFKMVVLCLLAVDPVESKYEFELRRVSQDLVIRSFDGDFVRLVESLLAQVYQVGIYIFLIATEDFLLQLYHIHRLSSEAIECRARLLELISKYEGDKIFQDRADSLRLSAKIAKARQDLDDSRIYVDLSRFSTWLKEHRMHSILQLIRSGTVDVDALEAMTSKDINASQGVEADIIRELAGCYREFCSNRIFGIASYLGRRIRHGTLRGTLLQDIETSVRERFPAKMGNPIFNAYFLEWKSNFDDFIKKMGSQNFHIKSQQKPHGMISPEISDGKKLQYLKYAAKLMAVTFEKYEDPEYYVGTVSEMCWQVASVDLRSSHGVISARKIEARLSALPENIKMILGEQARDYVRFINEHLEEKFNTVINWFERPKISVPSVDLATLIRVVDEEVKEEFPDYIGPAFEDSSAAIILTGVTYHIVYDFLYVAMKNAAHHGKAEGSVVLGISADLLGGRVVALKLSVSSEYTADDNSQKAQARVDACRLDGLESAYVEEGKSGLRKITRLERDWPEVKRVAVVPGGDRFVVNMELSL